jgi:hypothetical protein
MLLSDFSTLAEAKAYTTTQPKLIHRDSMNSLLASAGLYIALKGIALDSANPFQNLIAAFLDSVEYNFMVGDGTTTGDRQILALDSIIASGGDFGAAIASIKPVILAMANPTVNPFETKTAHDFELAKGIFNKVPITVESGFCSIITTADIESHNPQIYRKVTFGNGDVEYIRVAGFSAVSTAKLYRVQCPSFPNMYMDNAYSVVTQG